MLIPLRKYAYARGQQLNLFSLKRYYTTCSLGLAIRRPGTNKLAPLFESAAAPICLFCLDANDICQCHLDDFKREFLDATRHHAGALANTNKFQPYNPLRMGLVCRSKKSITDACGPLQIRFESSKALMLKPSFRATRPPKANGS